MTSPAVLSLSLSWALALNGIAILNRSSSSKTVSMMSIESRPALSSVISRVNSVGSIFTRELMISMISAS
jgi:hypothetical protein